MSKEKIDFRTEDAEGGYDSDFDDEDHKAESGKKGNVRKDLARKPQPNTHTQGLPHKSFFIEEQRRAEGYRNSYFALNAYERHRKLVNDYLLYYPGSAADLLKRDGSKDKNDFDIIREHHRFLWDESDETESQTWEKDLAKAYYDKLFREYGVCDLSKYTENKIAIRWRVQQEVVDGKGQFTCGEKKCGNSDELKTWEVNFAYMEESVKKNALVKLRLCPDCSVKLNFCQKRKEVTRKPKKRRSQHGSKSSDRKRTKVPEPDESAGPSIPIQEQTDEEAQTAAENIWKEPVLIPELKSREDEYNEYLEDLFL